MIVCQFAFCLYLQNNVMHKIKFYEISWKTFVLQGKSWMTIWLMRFECWITKATNIDSE
jgi:hypothetical protein